MVSVVAVAGWSRQPFGLAERAVVLEPGDRVLVFPSLGRLQRGRLRRFLGREAPSLGQGAGRAATPRPRASSTACVRFGPAIVLA